MIELTAEPISNANFAPFGQVIWPEADGRDWQPGDPELTLHLGQPRLYLMQLRAPGLRVNALAAHRLVTQCLGSMESHAWQIVVAAASHREDQPLDAKTNLRAFSVPPQCIVRLHRGTWHAGPLFESPAELVFCNLELHDTNSRDRAVLPLNEEQEVIVRPSQPRPSAPPAPAPDLPDPCR